MSDDSMQWIRQVGILSSPTSTFRSLLVFGRQYGEVLEGAHVDRV